MNRVFVSSISILADMQVQEEKELLDNILNGVILLKGGVISLSEYVRMREYRRMDRISILALLGFQPIIQKYINEGYDLIPCGTVMNTCFGPIETNIEFATSIVKNSEDGISPILFSHTVNNAALGHVCKKYCLKGPSTLVLSSDSLGIAIDLLASTKTDLVIHCGIDQHSQHLSKEFEHIGIKNNELVATIGLEQKKTDSSYSQILGGRTINLGGHPYFSDGDDDFSGMEEHYDKLLQLNNIDKKKIAYVITNNQYECLIKREQSFIKTLNDKCIYLNVGENVGEILGASLTFNIIIASLLCKHKYIESGQVILASAYDISGNYITYLIERI